MSFETDELKSTRIVRDVNQFISNNKDRLVKECEQEHALLQLQTIVKLPNQVDLDRICTNVKEPNDVYKHVEIKYKSNMRIEVDAKSDSKGNLDLVKQYPDQANKGTMIINCFADVKLSFGFNITRRDGISAEEVFQTLIAKDKTNKSLKDFYELFQMKFLQELFNEERKALLADFCLQFSIGR